QNTSHFGGGGIQNSGTLSVLNSIIAENSSTFHGASSGAGIANSGTLRLTNSTVSGNSANDDGGGIASFNGVVTLISSTIAANSSPGNGGGIYVSGTGGMNLA